MTNPEEEISTIQAFEPQTAIAAWPIKIVISGKKSSDAIILAGPYRLGCLQDLEFKCSASEFIPYLNIGMVALTLAKPDFINLPEHSISIDIGNFVGEDVSSSTVNVVISYNGQILGRVQNIYIKLAVNHDNVINFDIIHSKGYNTGIIEILSDLDWINLNVIEL